MIFRFITSVFFVSLFCQSSGETKGCTNICRQYLEVPRNDDSNEVKIQTLLDDINCVLYNGIACQQHVQETLSGENSLRADSSQLNVNSVSSTGNVRLSERSPSQADSQSRGDNAAHLKVLRPAYIKALGDDKIHLSCNTPISVDDCTSFIETIKTVNVTVSKVASGIYSDEVVQELSNELHYFKCFYYFNYVLSCAKSIFDNTAILQNVRSSLQDASNELSNSGEKVVNEDILAEIAITIRTTEESTETNSTTTEAPTSSSLSTAEIVFIAVGLVLGIVVIGLLIFVIYIQCCKSNGNISDTVSEISDKFDDYKRPDSRQSDLVSVRTTEQKPPMQANPLYDAEMNENNRPAPARLLSQSSTTSNLYATPAEPLYSYNRGQQNPQVPKVIIAPNQDDILRRQGVDIPPADYDFLPPPKKMPPPRSSLRREENTYYNTNNTQQPPRNNDQVFY